MNDAARLLGVYDRQLRGAAEVLDAAWSQAWGPLWLARYGTHGMVTYRTLAGLSGVEIDSLVADAAAHFAREREVEDWEWKTRSHDEPDDLGQHLLAAGLEPEEVETVMLGEAARLAALETELPEEVTVLRVDDRADAGSWIGRGADLQRTVFGRGPSHAEVVARFENAADRAGMWVAAVGDDVVAAGRLEVVPGTECAGLWGGAVHPDWRGRGLYRALVAARAAWGLERGVRYLHSDCTAMSRPILERAGLVPVTTTTPYVARTRPDADA